jgi:hypothetical protein
MRRRYKSVTDEQFQRDTQRQVQQINVFTTIP